MHFAGSLIENHKSSKRKPSVNHTPAWSSDNLTLPFCRKQILHHQLIQFYTQKNCFTSNKNFDNFRSQESIKLRQIVSVSPHEIHRRIRRSSLLSFAAPNRAPRLWNNWGWRWVCMSDGRVRACIMSRKSRCAMHQLEFMTMDELRKQAVESLSWAQNSMYRACKRRSYSFVYRQQTQTYGADKDAIAVRKVCTELALQHVTSTFTSSFTKP